MKRKTEAFVTNSRLETESMGERLAKGLSPGDIVGLSGELGTGKTCLVRGVARGLGVKGKVKSPSFTIMNVYEGVSFPLYHIDLYRLEDMDEFHGAGLEEFIYGKGVCVIEWVEKIPGLINECGVVIRLLRKGERRRAVEIERRS